MGKPYEGPADKLQLYERLVATEPRVERKGATLPYTSVNGHMFSFLTKDGTLALRLGAEERESFIAEHRTKLFEQAGTVLKEYVVVPASLLANTASLESYFASSYRYVSSLKPKASARSKVSSKRPPSKKRATKKRG